MVRIAPVHMGLNPKTLWFDAGELEIADGDGLVLDTARGREYGRAAGEVFEASYEQVKKLRSGLKPVVRLATEEDEAQAREMERLSAEALPVFKQMAAESGEGMRPVSVEYLLDGEKAVFYFEAEERIDFRDLVRRLAARFHVRVDMRQIGVRDEARMIGGLGHCGQELCCRRLGGEFCPVSIRMAKEQDLSLNPQKISGVCGRLMCCLRYEYDAYRDFNKRAPKRNATIQTPEGSGKVSELDVPREVVSVRLEGEKPVKVPLADFEPAEEGARPNVVGQEAWERAVEGMRSPLTGTHAALLNAQLSDGDALADPTSVRRVGGSKKGGRPKSPAGKRKGQEKGGGSQRRQRKGQAASSPGHKDSGGKGSQGGKRAGAAQRTGRRRRSTKIDAETGEQRQRTDAPRPASDPKGKGDRRQKPQQRPSGQGEARSSARPGQRSSAIRARHDPDASPASGAGSDKKRRPRRRRSHSAGDEAPGKNEG